MNEKWFADFVQRQIKWFEMFFESERQRKESAASKIKAANEWYARIHR